MATFSSKTVAKYDDYTTPKSAWEAIKKYIPADKTIWEAFYCDGSSGKALEELGFTTIHRNVDFFTHNLGDIVVSNPPFSKKKEVLTRLKELDKPFVLLMPQAVLHTKYFRELFADTDIQLIVPRKRVQFGLYKDGIVKYEGKCNFDCFYYCYKMGLKNSIQFL